MQHYAVNPFTTIVTICIMDDEEVIIIEDDDDDVIFIEDNNLDNNSDADEDNQLMEIDNFSNDSSDEDRVLSEDSDYDSDCSVVTDFNQRILNRVEINSLRATKMCCIYFYYKSEHNEKFYTCCFIRISDLFSNIRVVREHTSTIYDLILGSYCRECRKPLYQIMPSNMCPICTV